MSPEEIAADQSNILPIIGRKGAAVTGPGTPTSEQGGEAAPDLWLSMFPSRRNRLRRSAPSTDPTIFSIPPPENEP
jgi:hypothetical protein